MDSWASQLPIFLRRRKFLLAGAGLLMLFDIARLWILPNSLQTEFTDGFETLVVFLCVFACVIAAKRSSPVGKGLWIMAAVFFVLLGTADLHDFLLDISFHIGSILTFIELLGWTTYLPLALLIFFPAESDGRPDWTWLPYLDFLLVTVAAALAYFRLIFVPHFRADLPWTVFGRPELTRDALISTGLLLRSLVDPSLEARAFYHRVGGVFAGITFLQAAFVTHVSTLYPTLRPALWLVLGVMAVCWEVNPSQTHHLEAARRQLLRVALSLFAAATLFLVVALAFTSPRSYRQLTYAVLVISVALFILRSVLAEHSRHNSEIRLQNSERDYRILFDSAVVPILIFEPQSQRIIQANVAACELYDFPPGGLMGQSLKDFATNAVPGERIAELMKSGAPVRFEGAHRTRAGIQIDVQISSSLIQYGGQQAVLSFIRNITERKRAEDALKKSELSFRTLIEDAPLAIGISRNAINLYANKMYLKMYGFDSAGDLVGKPIGDRLAPAWRDELKLRSRLREQGVNVPSGYEAVGQRKDGSQFPIFVSVTKVNLPDGPATLAFITDISERKRAEEALRHSEQRYRDFITHSSDAVWRVELERPLPLQLAENDAVGHVLKHGYMAECNDAMARILGFSSASEILGKRIGELVSPNDHGRIESFHQVIRQDWAVKSVQFETTDRAGNRKVLDRTAVPIVQDGNIIRIWGVTRDITELQRAEEELRRSEARFRTTFESAAIGMALVDANGHPVEVNDALQRFLGYDEAELRLMPFTEFTHPDDRDVDWRLYAELLEGERGSYELQKRYVRKDGKVVWGHLTVSLVRDSEGRSKYAVGMVEDITDRKSAEKALVLLSEAMNASGEVIFMTDRDGLITSVNPEFTRVYGYTAEEVVGRSTPRILRSGERTNRDYEIFWKSILNKRVVRGDITNEAKDGRLVSIHSSVSPILDEHGGIAGFLAIQRDITERRELEEQFRQAQKMEAIGRLAGGVAHDFNNLLTIINGYAQLLQDEFALQDPRRAQLEAISKAGDRAAALTRQLLAFSRKQVLEPRVLDLNAVVQGMQEMLRRLLGEDIELRITTAHRPELIKADAAQIEQVILNLAVNARDAMPHGGALLMEVADAEVDESESRGQSGILPGHYAILAVTDTGVGMDTRTLAHIFEPFFTTKEQGKGTGLGLSTVFGIVKQSGGHVSVSSEPGQGTTFRVYLPDVVGSSAEVTVGEQPARPPGGSETILLVEDEEAVRAIAIKVLRDYGYQVLEGSTPSEAVKIGEEYEKKIDLLLTDVVMPGLSGRNVAEHLAFSRPKMKVLYMSGYTDDAIVHHGVLEAGVAFLQKPFTPEQLAMKVREVLDTAAR